ncbi:hypothetical protein [Paracidovorax citrulli]
MRNVLQFVGHTLQSGTCASTLSTLALACAGHFETRHAVAPVNAISHWIWGDRAIHVNWPAWRYTAVGYLIHHATSVFWAAFYEGWTSRSPERRRTFAAVGAGLAVAAVACVVDLKFTPRRLTPGFERRLSPLSLGLVYLAFGLALPLATLWRERKRENARAIPEEQERRAA